ncbi:hypothetical protein HUN88_15290 [Bacillus amyloliquefaciens]|uniref:hypothetical protein n=1 Tax=Bacillus TaxID=1386 RepID=UPI00157FCB0A|nr:hypothetical protein [Bacillus amyloliquefaciens]NUI61118.1 hypothetical protein [Bacillus amyloliquefaciens]
MDKSAFPKVLTNTDIATRWGKTRRAVYNTITRNEDFPEPVAHVQNGQVPLYLESDIIEYEKKKGIEPVI